MDEQNLDQPPLSTDSQMTSNQTSSGQVSETKSDHPTTSPDSEAKSDQPAASQDSKETSDQPITNPMPSDKPTPSPESQQNSEEPVTGVTSDNQKITSASEQKTEQPSASQVSEEISDQPISKPVSEPKSAQPTAKQVSPPKSVQPPQYRSIFGELNDVRSTSGGNVMAIKRSFSIISASMGCTILLGIILAVPVSMIVIGSIYLNDCPVQRNIPIYLIVGGCFTIVSDMFSLIQKCRSSGRDEEQASGLSVACNSIIGCFLFAWFICGNIWIYTTYRNFSTNVTDPNYCHPTLLYYSFWLLTASYILSGLVCVLLLFGGIIMLFCALKSY